MEGKQKHIMKKISNVPTGVSVAFIQCSYTGSQRSFSSVRFSSVQSLSHVWLFVTPWIAACQASLSITNSRSLPKFVSIELVMPTSGSFQMSQLFASGGQSNGVSASTSVPPINTQDCSPLGWTGWISLLSKGLLRVFSKQRRRLHMALASGGWAGKCGTGCVP